MHRISILILTFALLLLQGCGGDPEPVKIPVRPVKTIVVGEHGYGKQWTFAGMAEDALETPLSFRVKGKIIDFPGDQIGRKFAKGEIIARLDPTDYELQLRQADANMAQIRANFIRAEADMKRNLQLFERKVISQSELDQSEAEFKSYKAQLNASAKQLDIARKSLSYTKLHAPFDGWINSVNVKKHQNVPSGEPVVSLNAGQQMKMYIAVPDTLIAQIHEGDEVEVHFDALPDKTMNGKVMEIGMGANAGSSYPVKVYLDNKDKIVRSGMTGHVRFLEQSNGLHNLFLPPAAVLSDATGIRSIWVVDKATSTVQAHAVTLGSLTANGIEIMTGVKSGDIVVVRGVHHLKEGLKVRLMQNGAES